jgi:hypothetical protein
MAPAQSCCGGLLFVGWAVTSTFFRRQLRSHTAVLLQQNSTEACRSLICEWDPAYGC